MKYTLRSKTIWTIVLLLFLSFNIKAQSGNFISLKVENSVIIDEPAKKIWSLISDVKNFSSLVPEVIKEVEVNGNGVYSSWIIYLKNGNLITEEMIYFNPEEMECSYIMTKTPMALSDYLAIQRVEKISKNQSKVTFTAYYNVSSQINDNLKETFHNFQNTFLANIKTNIL
jgi:hypothetical protein